MKRRIAIILSFVCITLLVAPQLVHPATERRVALVIGNGAYKTAPLKNPTNDAHDMTASLEKLGFKVAYLENASQKEMEDAIRLFGRNLRKGGIGLFFYAGHGVQVQGANYLIPLAAKIEKETDVKYEAVDANRILDEMYEAGNGLNLIILDACRDNPFARGFRSGRRGLARMDAPTGTFIAFATAPGSVASDGEGRNGIFTQYILKHMKTPGMKIEDVLKKVRRDVILQTRNKQVPWQSSSLTGDFFFTQNEPGRDAIMDEKSPDVPSSLPQVTFDDLREEANKVQKWKAWQVAMSEAWTKAEELERMAYLSPAGKAEAWQRLLDAYKADNPYSQLDQLLREKAQERQAYWLNPKKDDTITQKETSLSMETGPPWLGVMLKPITNGMAQFLDLNTNAGVFVDSIEANGPADQAGLVRGDVIVEVDGREIKGYSDIQSLVSELHVGQEIEITLIRNGRAKAMNMKIGQKSPALLASEEWHEKGLKYLEAGNYDHSIEVLTKSLEEFPRAMSYTTRGNAYYKKGDIPQAISDYSMALGLDPESAYVYYARSFAWKQKGNIKKALIDATKALSLEPSEKSYLDWLTKLSPPKNAARLYVNTEPADAQVIIYNIKPSYIPGIELQPGTYQIKISKKGYRPIKKQVELTVGQNIQVEVTLHK